MDKQKIRDRINELEFKRNEYIWVLKGHTPLLIGLTVIFISLTFYQLDKGKIFMAVMNLILFGSIVFFLSKLYSFSSSKNKKIEEKIQNNYDLLLDRKKSK